MVTYRKPHACFLKAVTVKHTPYPPAVGGVAETCAKRRSLLRPPSPIPHHPREARVWGMGLAETRAKRGFSASLIIIYKVYVSKFQKLVVPKRLRQFLSDLHQTFRKGRSHPRAGHRLYFVEIGAKLWNL